MDEIILSDKIGIQNYFILMFKIANILKYLWQENRDQPK